VAAKSCDAPLLIGIAREKGVSAYIGEGSTIGQRCTDWMPPGSTGLCWKKEQPVPAITRLAEESIPFRDIAGVIGRRLAVPVVGQSPEAAAAHFGWFANFAGIDNKALSARTREFLGWQPAQPGLIADRDRPRYFET